MQITDVENIKTKSQKNSVSAIQITYVENIKTKNQKNSMSAIQIKGLNTA